MLCSIDGKDVLFGGVDSYTKRLITIGNTNSLKSINLEMGNTVLVTSTETSVNRTPSDTSTSIPYQIMLKIM